jgi:hypothetical protein
MRAASRRSCRRTPCGPAPRAPVRRGAMRATRWPTTWGMATTSSLSLPARVVEDRRVRRGMAVPVVGWRDVVGSAEASLVAAVSSRQGAWQYHPGRGRQNRQHQGQGIQFHPRPTVVWR